jgi:hypothetical protein
VIGTPEPKSACKRRFAPIELTIARELPCRGSLLTCLFQTFVLGRTGQFGARDEHDDYSDREPHRLLYRMAAPPR